MAKTLGSLAIGDKLAIMVDGAVRSHLVMHHGKPSDIYDDSFDGGTILLMKDLYDRRAWHSSDVNDYANSTIHTYLNGTFLNLIDEKVRAEIKQVKIPYRAGSGTSSTVSSGANGLSTRVFLPSAYEVGFPATTYMPADGAAFGYFSGAANALRIGYLNGTATRWWLRSPSTGGATNAWRVNTTGASDSSFCSGSDGIRPALVLPSGQLVTDDPNAGGNYELVHDTVAYLDYIYRKSTANEGRMPVSALFTIPVKDFESAERVLYLLTNNFNDGAGVVWEPSEYGQEHIFANQSKTANTWRVALRVMAERGELGKLYSGEPLLKVLYEG